MASKGWPVLSLKDICLPKNGIRRGPFGGSLKKSSFVPSGYKVYEQANVIYDDFNSGNYYINEAKFESLKAFEVFPHDLLISCSGTVGKVVVVPERIQPGVMNQALLRLRPDLTKVLTKYIWIVLNSDDAQRKITGATHGSAMKNIVAVGQIKKIGFPIPDIEVQESVVAVVSSWMDSITSLERLIDAKTRLKQGLMQKLLAGKVRFNGFGAPDLKGKLPPGWMDCKVRDLCQLNKGRGLSKDAVGDSGKYKCILYGELYTVYFEVVDEIKSFTDADEGIPSKAGDILIPGSTTTEGIDLANAVMINEAGVRLGGDINILRQKAKNYSPKFLAYYLTYARKNDIVKLAQGATIVHLYGKQIANIDLQIPSLLEQEKIAGVIEAASREIHLLKQQLLGLKKQKNSLVAKLLTGEIPVRV